LIFFTLTMNVFIAVLGDSYDIQQEKMLCTFMKERAKLCSKLLMSPSRRTALGVFALGVLSWAGALIPDVGEWPKAIFLALFLTFAPAGAMQLLRACLQESSKSKWSESHLWFCHESNVENSFLMNSDLGDLDDNHSGRLQRIKRSVFDVKRCMTEQSRSTQAQQSALLSLQREMAAMAHTVRVMVTPQHRPALRMTLTEGPQELEPLPGCEGANQVLYRSATPETLKDSPARGSGGWGCMETPPKRAAEGSVMHQNLGMRQMEQMEQMQRRQEDLEAKHEGLAKTCQEMSADIKKIVSLLEDAQQRNPVQKLPASIGLTERRDGPLSI
jgi:hypothetical protein